MEKLTKENFDDILSLTPMQEGMLFHYLGNPESDLYFEQLSLVIAGKIHQEIFEKAWNGVIKSNEMLRTVFRWENVPQPVQIILKEHRFQPGYYDLSPHQANEALKYLEELKINDRKTSFDLHHVPFRVTLCKMPEDQYIMISSNHHILFDGWSLGILLKEFFHFYDEIAAGNPFIIPTKTPYKKFIEWLNRQDETAREKFWRNYLVGFDQPLELSIKNTARKKITSIENYLISFEPMLRSQSGDFVRLHKITLASLFYSALGILLLKYNNSEELIFGTVVSGRPAEINGIEDIVGLFINTPPLRIRALSPQTSIEFAKNLDGQL
ncbi:MAG: condensation domain-containing protein, partial [Acidobacteria bacterium]|nr:condensation domain-containing protein [Acidobacteriota bacterium]